MTAIHDESLLDDDDDGGVCLLSKSSKLNLDLARAIADTSVEKLIVSNCDLYTMRVLNTCVVLISKHIFLVFRHHRMQLD